MATMIALFAPRPATKPVAVHPGSAAAMGTRTRGFYRHDLDGLRGVAILLVAVFHIWFGRVSGGVDVFLALSGFFFGGKLLRVALNPSSSLSPVRDLIRLVRRLLPALVVVLAACAGLTYWIQPQTRWETFADQSLASLGYYQNWELARTAADYLRAGEAVSPLQHIWSMSVQGQFYLSFLLLIFGFAFLARRVLGRHLRAAFVVVLTALTVASLAYAVVAHQSNQSLAYYNSFARAWELLIGALAGALVPSIRWSVRVRTAVGTLALAAILSCGALIDGVRQFPGPWALVPVGAAVAFILAGANRTHSDASLPWPNRWLASGPLVTLGAMSYSLYLWHWPLLIFWLSYSGHRHASVADGAVILLVSTVLAYLTTRFVEDPLRVRAPAGPGPTPVLSIPSSGWWRRRTLALGATVVLLGAAVIATSLSWRQQISVQRADSKELVQLSRDDYPGARALLRHEWVPKVRMRPTILEAKRDLPQSTRDGCISTFSNGAVINCTYGDPDATRTIALAGGSHAEHWLPALDILGRQHHFKVVTYLKMGCPLSTEPVPLIMGNNAPYPQCHQWVEQTMDKLIADHPDYVFTTATRPWNIKPGDVMPGTYIGIWERLSENNIPILGVRDTPWLVHDDGSPFEPADCLASGGDDVSCGIPRSHVLAERNPALDFVSRFPLLRPLDLSDAVCEPDICRAVEGNVLIYHDSHHLSATYMRTMAGELGRQMGKATGWW